MTDNPINPKNPSEWTEEALEAASRTALQQCCKHARELGFECPSSGTADELRERLAKVASQHAKLMKALSSEKSSEGQKRPVEKLSDAPSWPVEKTAEPTPGQFKVWKREVNAWQRMMKEDAHGANAMFQAFMRVLPSGVKQQCYGEIDDEFMSIESVMQVLERDFGGVEEVDESALLTEYRALSRGAKETLGEFLKRWRRVRTKALTQGAIEKSRADVNDFLRACALNAQQHGQILMDLKREEPKDRLEFVLGRVEVLVKMFGLRDQKEPEVAFVADDGGKPKGGGKGDQKPWWKQPAKGGKPGGKGKGAKGKGKGVWKEIQKQPWKGAAKQDWKKDDTKGKPKGKKGGGKGEAAKGDWTCEKCQYLVFGRMGAGFCPQCGAARP